jgi:hypothetical protein
MDFNRNQRVAKRIAIIDGTPRSGKSIIASIISSYKNSEQYILTDKTLDNLCRIYHVKKISKDAIETLINLYVDMELYDLQLARNVNFNQNDISSIYYSLNGKRYENRAKLKDDDNVLLSIENKNPIVNLMMHDALNFSQIIHETLGNRLLTHVIMQRHPLKLFFDLYERRKSTRLFSDPKVFELFLVKNNTPIDVCVEDKQFFLESNELGKIIYTIVCSFPSRNNKAYQGLKKVFQNKIIFIPFEDFVVSPEKYLVNIAEKMNTQATRLTKDVMGKENIPRKNIDLDLISLRQRYVKILKTTKLDKNLILDFENLIKNYEKNMEKQ